MRLACQIALGCIFLSVSVPASAAVIFTSRAAFDAATTGQSVTTFEENPSFGFTFYGSTYPGGDFSITSSSVLYTVDPDFASFYGWGSGDVLDFEGGPGTITVDPAVTAFGFDFGNPSGIPGSGVITINGVDYAQLGQPTFNFFGIIDTAPIGPLTINFNGGLGILDNFTVASEASAVPEPGTLTLAGLGGVLLGGIRRRRRRAQ